MKKIDTKEYQDLIGAFERCKEFNDEYGCARIINDEDEILHQNMVKLQNSYNNYCTLLHELKCCIKNYTRTKDALKTIMYKRVRKIDSINKRKK
ncbi:hypothetical protein [Chryseobacterium sp. 2R14A]|uniref:hypothetical protein n=1 Tax=Chryseobacterium sp. 2R14A TaxID=3380353 RepID=UPI003CF3C4FA